MTKIIEKEVIVKASQDTTSKESVENGKMLGATTRPLDPKELVEKSTTLDASTNIENPIAIDEAVAASV